MAHGSEDVRMVIFTDHMNCDNLSAHCMNEIVYNATFLPPQMYQKINQASPIITNSY